MIERNGARTRTLLELQVPDSFVTVPYNIGEDDPQTRTTMLKGRDDKNWQTAFCAGDKIKVATGKVNLQTYRITDRLDLGPYKIKSLGPRGCVGE